MFSSRARSGSDSVEETAPPCACATYVTALDAAPMTKSGSFSVTRATIEAAESRPSGHPSSRRSRTGRVTSMGFERRLRAKQTPTAR